MSTDELFFAGMVMKSAKTPIKKWGARQQASPLIPKSGGGLEPSGPIGVYAYARAYFSPFLFSLVFGLIFLPNRTATQYDRLLG